MSTDKDNPNLPPPRSVGSVKPKHIPATTIGKQANEKSHILRSNKQATAAAVNLHPQQEDVKGISGRGNGSADPLPGKGTKMTHNNKIGKTSSKVNSQSNSSQTELEPFPPPPPPPRTENDMSQLVASGDLEGNGGVPATQKSSLAHASFNYINSILGSGVIGMPYALAQAGVGLGLILMVFVAYITDYSLVLMVRSGQLSGSFTYQGMMESAFGRWGFYVLTLLQLTYPLIAMISYNIIVGDTLTKVLVSLSSDPHGVTLQREAVVLIVTLIVTLPLSLYRNVARMSKVSFFSLISIGFIMISILIRLHTDPQAWTSDSWEFANTGVIQACGVFAFAFMCHHNTFMIYGSMEESSEAKWRKVTHVSIGTSLAVSLIFSLGGYATFTGNVQGDLLENYCWDDDLINVSRFLFCITILLTFPLECFVVRDVIENFWFKEKQPATTSRHFSITFSIVILAYIISMSTDCLGIVLELNGVLAAIPLAFILPALCYIRLEPSRFWSRAKLPAIGIAAFGILVSTVGLLMLIVNGQSSNCSHGQPMAYCTTQSPFRTHGGNTTGSIPSSFNSFNKSSVAASDVSALYP